MIIGGSKDRVIANIRTAALAGDFNAKVEVDDPKTTVQDDLALSRELLRHQKTFTFHLRNRVCRFLVDMIGRWSNRSTEYVGLENLAGIDGGAIVTGNHFNPVDFTVLRSAVKKAGRSRLFVVSHAENLATKGMVWFFMNYIDIIPINDDKSFMKLEFPALIQENLRKKGWVLIFSEEEMWLNYRKPRPPKRGAYYYAAKFNVPIVSMFVEIREAEGKENGEFKNTRYVVHVLPSIYPDPDKTVRENSLEMMRRDYEQKVAAYEQAYGKPLTYEFSSDDVAGWIPPEERELPCDLSAPALSLADTVAAGEPV